MLHPIMILFVLAVLITFGIFFYIDHRINRGLKIYHRGYLIREYIKYLDRLHPVCETNTEFGRLARANAIHIGIEVDGYDWEPDSLIFY